MVYRHSSQDVCPWNVRFCESLPDDSPFASREVVGNKDARTLVLVREHAAWALARLTARSGAPRG